MSFNDVVRGWLIEQGVAADEVLGVTARGSDWCGDTESGFHDETDTVIRYRIDGTERARDVEATEYESFWKHIIGGWGQ